jgi:hypothetical protein
VFTGFDCKLFHATNSMVQRFSHNTVERKAEEIPSVVRSSSCFMLNRAQ